MKYPNGLKKQDNHLINYANRGMDLESEINRTNQYYKETRRAYIYKKPTPIKITKVDYKQGIIKEAFFESPSTTDYNGIYRGYYIDFEAKETVSKTSFPLKNIHPHQIEHMKNVEEEGGICFLIVRFKTLNQTFILKAKDLFLIVEEQKRKSIPLDYFLKKGYLIKDKYRPTVDYLEIIDQLYGGEPNAKNERQSKRNQKETK